MIILQYTTLEKKMEDLFGFFCKFSPSPFRHYLYRIMVRAASSAASAPSPTA